MRSLNQWIYTRRARPQILLVIILSALQLLLHRSTSVKAQDLSPYSNYSPIRYKVNQKQTECLYERFEKGEHVTFSIFVMSALSNGKPMCNALYEGPLTQQTMDNDENDRKKTLGRMIRQGVINEWSKIQGDATKSINYHAKIDWTHAGEEEDKLLMRQEIERDNIKRQREHSSSSNNDHHHKPRPLIAPSRIEPYEITQMIPTTGYYRLCAQAELQALIVEMDIRSASKMRGIDPETGHVYTYAQRNLLDEEAALDDKGGKNNNKGGRLLNSNTYQSRIEELTKALNNQVDSSDLQQTRDQIKILNARISDILSEIQIRMTRIRAHEQSAKRNSANLAWNAKMETLLFAVISGFQVYTVRKWLLSNTLLGR